MCDFWGGVGRSVGHKYKPVGLSYRFILGVGLVYVTGRRPGKKIFFGWGMGFKKK